MPANATLTIELIADLAGRLGQLAATTNRSRDALAVVAIAAYVGNETDTIAGIEQGLKEMRAGRLVPHEEAMARLDATIAATAPGRR